MDDIKGKVLTLRPGARRLVNGQWESILSAWWDQGENTFDRKIPLDGEFPSKEAALQHAAEEAKPFAAMNQVPPDWLR
jgi:hypothetical protein